MRVSIVFLEWLSVCATFVLALIVSRAVTRFLLNRFGHRHRFETIEEERLIFIQGVPAGTLMPSCRIEMCPECGLSIAIPMPGLQWKIQTFAKQDQHLPEYLGKGLGMMIQEGTPMIELSEKEMKQFLQIAPRIQFTGGEEDK